MEIERNLPFSGIQKARAPRKTTTAKPSSTSQTSESPDVDRASFFSELVDRLSQMPDMREEILAEARDLLHDPDYPSEDELEKLEFAIAQR